MHVLGGEFKGRNLLPPPGRSITRPITGAVKKSLFGMLGEDLAGQNVLDLYCGTGTLGIEALSRGARRCAFAENDFRVVQCLKRNLQTLGAMNRAIVWVGDVAARLGGWLENETEPIDLAFVDPPYAQAREWDWLQMGEAIFAPLAAHLAEDGIVTLRLPAEVELPPRIGPLDILRQRTYGGMGLALLGKSGA